MCLGRHEPTEETRPQRCASAHNSRSEMRCDSTQTNITGTWPSHILYKPTLRLPELVEHHDVVRVIEIFSQRVDFLTGQPVGHEHCCSVTVCPVDPILRNKHKYVLILIIHKISSVVLGKQDFIKLSSLQFTHHLKKYIVYLNFCWTWSQYIYTDMGIRSVGFRW